MLNTLTLLLRLWGYPFPKVIFFWYAVLLNMFILCWEPFVYGRGIFKCQFQTLTKKCSSIRFKRLLKHFVRSIPFVFFCLFVSSCRLRPSVKPGILLYLCIAPIMFYSHVRKVLTPYIFFRSMKEFEFSC